MENKSTKNDKGVFNYTRHDTLQEFHCERCESDKKSKIIVKWTDLQDLSKTICNSCYGFLLIKNIVKNEYTSKVDKFAEEVRLRRERKKALRNQFKDINVVEKKLKKDKLKARNKKNKKSINPLNPNGYKYGSTKIISTPMK